MSERDETIEDIRERGAYALASDADTMSPDTLESPGAKFLGRVRDDVLENYESETAGDSDEWAHEIADSAIPVYTHDLMLTYVDLGAYQEDVREFSPQDGIQHAQFALYEVARNLVHSLITEIEDADSEADQ